MADIDIVPKRGTSIWLWVVLVLLALAVLFWFMTREPTPSVQLDDGRPAAITAAGAVAQVPMAA